MYASEHHGKPYVTMTHEEAEELDEALAWAVASMVAFGPKGGRFEKMLANVRKFREAHRKAHGLNNPASRRCAPWPDFAGHPIHEGDTIRHPTGQTGIVKYVPTGPDGRLRREETDRWFVDYGEKPWSRLVLQIGDRGRAVVV